jgi:adenosylcobinamide kinase/adenosylcobinamide-phosphate guanylyltransferase
MLYLITGVSGSGKSEYAENLAVKLSELGSLYYVATMEPYGEEGQARIERHRRLREGKGFQTIESPRNIAQNIGQIGEEHCADATILLETLSTLLANEMFSGGEKADTAPSADRAEETADVSRDKYDVADRLLSEICRISRLCKHLLVVTDEVFADGLDYPPETTEYMRQLGKANRELARRADEAVEIVYSLPVSLRSRTE